MRTKRTLKYYQDIAASRGGKCLSTEYFRCEDYGLWECSKGYQWEATFHNVNSGKSWCPHCAPNKKRNLKYYQDIAISRGGKCLSTSYKNCHAHGKWECSEGHQWEAMFYCVSAAKQWCPECAGNKKHVMQDCKKLAKSRGGKCLSRTYINANTKYTWQCKLGHVWDATYASVSYGRWCPTCYPEKAKQTNMERYGVPHSSQNREIALKTARSSNKSTIILHWRTNEELVCTASYEKAVVEYFNTNHIDFHWQPEVFTMPDGHTYRPDCYLPKEDLWLEIKGYFRGDAEIKWLWFHKEHPNSQLWNKQKLKELQII